MSPAGLFIFGFGGHARSVGDVALATGIARLLFIDPAMQEGDGFGEFPSVAVIPDEPHPGWVAFVAIGDNRRRQALCETIDLAMPAIVAPTASLGYLAKVGDAAFVGHQAHVGPLANIARGVIINSGAIVDHESTVGAFSHVSVNATVAGRCSIGAHVFIGAGATVIDGISIASGATIGAGATVVRDITDPGTYVGTPARLVRA